MSHKFVELLVKITPSVIKFMEQKLFGKTYSAFNFLLQENKGIQ